VPPPILALERDFYGVPVGLPVVELLPELVPVAPVPVLPGVVTVPKPEVVGVFTELDPESPACGVPGEVAVLGTVLPVIGSV
jgi:hypothetical protein